MGYYDIGAISIPFNPLLCVLSLSFWFSDTKESGQEWNLDNEPDQGNPLPAFRNENDHMPEIIQSCLILSC